MIPWRFICYKKTADHCEISKQLAKVSTKGRAKLLRTLETLQCLPQHRWERPHASTVINADHIYVIRFTDENRTQHRIFGNHQGGYFICTLMGIEKGGKYEPANYGKIAVSRMGDCERDFHKYTCNCGSGSWADSWPGIIA